MAGCFTRSGTSCSALVRLYITLAVACTCTKISRAANGGNGKPRYPISFPKPGAAALDKSSLGARPKHHLSGSAKPGSSTSGKHDPPAVRGKNGGRTGTTEEQSRTEAVWSVLPPGTHSSAQQKGGLSKPQLQARANEGGISVKELGAKFEARSGEKKDSANPGRQVRLVVGEPRTPASHAEAEVEAEKGGKRARDLKRLFEQGAGTSLPDSGTLASHSLKAQNSMRTPEKNSTPGTKATKFKKLSSAARADQAAAAMEPGPESRSVHAPSKASNPVAASSLPSPLPGPAEPIYENLRTNVANVYNSSISYGATGSRLDRSTAQNASAAYKSRQTSTPPAKGQYGNDASNAGVERTEEPIYDMVPLEAAHVSHGAKRLPHKNVRRIPQRLLTRRGVTSRRQVSRRSGGSRSGWSMRTVFNVFSHTYLPLGLPLLLAGLFGGDQLLTLAGIVLFGGGSFLNLVSLVALWLRRVPPSDIVPMTAHNFEILFVLPPILAVSTLTLLNFHVTTLLAAVVSQGWSDYLGVLVPFCTVTYLIGLAVFLYAVYESVIYRRQNSAADLESANPRAMDFEEGQTPTFEMFYSPTTAPGSDQSDSEALSPFAQHHPRLSRLFDYVRLNFYQPFVTTMGVTLAAAICLGRHLGPVPDTEYTGDTSSLPLTADRPNTVRQYLQMMRMLPTFARGESLMSAASPSLVAIGGVGVIYLLIAVGNALLRWTMSCVRCIAYSQPCWRRGNRGPRVALTYYPFGLGVATITIGFLSASIEASRRPDCSFAHIMEYGTAIFGILVALLPTVWTTLQSLGLPLSTILTHFNQVELSHCPLADASQTHGGATEQTGPPRDSQRPAGGHVPLYDTPEGAAEEDSLTVWDSDED